MHIEARLFEFVAAFFVVTAVTAVSGAPEVLPALPEPPTAVRREAWVSVVTAASVGPAGPPVPVQTESTFPFR